MQITKLLLISIICIFGVNSQAQQSNTGFDKAIYRAISFKNKDYDSLYFYIKKANKIALSTQNFDQRVDALNIVIESKIRQGYLLEALAYCDTLELIINTKNIPHRQIDFYINLGNTYLSMGFISEALDLFFKGLETPYENRSNKQHIDLLYYIALAYYEIGKYEDCIEYAKSSLIQAESYEYSKDEIPPLLLISNASSSIDSIQYYLNKTMKALEKDTTLQYEKSAIIIKKASINKALGNYNLAYMQYNNAINICRQHGFNEILTIVLNNFGYLLMAQNKVDSAGLVFSQALQLAKQLNNLDNLAEVYDSYKDYHKYTQQYQFALSYFDSSQIYRTQYREQQQIQKSLFLSAVFETEQKEKQIIEGEKQLLIKQNRLNLMWIYLIFFASIIIIVVGVLLFYRQRAKLNKSLLLASEKDKAIQIANEVFKSTDDERKRISRDLHEGISSKMTAFRHQFNSRFKSDPEYMAFSEQLENIHETVRSISHNMSPKELERLGPVTAINNIVNALSSNQAINIRFNSNLTKRLPDIYESNIYFICLELINNAVRHSKANNIDVQLLDSGNNTISLSVVDDGRGFDVEKNFEGVGLRNIKFRSELIGGSLFVESVVGSTIFGLEIPINDD